jgi:hypothetical protein
MINYKNMVRVMATQQQHSEQINKNQHPNCFISVQPDDHVVVVVVVLRLI